MTRKLVIFKCMTDLVSIPDYIMKYSEIPAMQRLKNIDMNCGVEKQVFHYSRIFSHILDSFNPYGLPVSFIILLEIRNRHWLVYFMIFQHQSFHIQLIL